MEEENILVSKEILAPGLVDSKLDSRSKGSGFEYHPILDGNGVKTMPS
jgi:hypothetical protein